jgi:archaemetzincin
MEIEIFPMGQIDEEILEEIAKGLKRVYGIDAKISFQIKIPEEAYNPLRNQYSGEKIIRWLEKNFKERILAITNEDLYAEGLNFIFGQAQFGGRIAIISIFRLNPIFYKKPFDKNLLIERAVKEAIHEIGHTLKLEHCSNEKCVMCFSNTIRDVDKKGKDLCGMCKIQLGIKV